MRAQSSVGWTSYLLVPVSLVLLNASLTFQNVWPTPRIRWGSALSIELVGFVLVLTLGPRLATRWTRHALPGLWLLLVAGHYLDVTAPGLYGRDFNLYWDSQHLGNVAAMLVGSIPWWLIGVSTLGGLLLVAAVFIGARLAIAQVATSATRPFIRRALMTTAVLLLALFVDQRVFGHQLAPFADPVTGAYARQARYVLAMVGPGATAPVLSPSPAFDSRFRALSGADVILVFLESYGAVTFETPTMAAALTDSRSDLAASAAETGRQVLSAYVDSPTFGASSWLAHLSLLSGVEVRDQYAYSSLMASDRDTILTLAERQGYRTVGLLPGMRQAWPEGAFYGFDVIYGHDDLHYSGPRFGWWEIPDQYALAKLDALERSAPTRQPVFVVFPTSTTHAPFGPVAPYQSDWSRVLGASPYEADDVARAMADRPDLTDLTPSYLKAMAYDFHTLAGYLREQHDDPVVIVIGDHQPPAAVSGKDASWRVPVHVITRNLQVLQGLARHGFGQGLEPRLPSIGPMHTLIPVLLDAFDAPAYPGDAASSRR